MEDVFIIKGGKKLSGEIKLSGAKNVALKTIIGALLFDGEVILENIPKINDVLNLIDLIVDLGAEAKFIGPGKLKINGQSLIKRKVDFLRASKLRVSFMLFAPLLHRFGTAFIPNPGGCRLGARPIDRVVEGMKKLGVMVDYQSETGFYQAEMNAKPRGEYLFKKPSHTGTELLIILAAIGDRQVVIKNAALEPEIDDLINFLKSGGAKIKREGKKIIINGVNHLHQSEQYRIVADRNEAVTFVCLSLATGGEITIRGIEKLYLEDFFINFKKAGGRIDQLGEKDWHFSLFSELKAMNIETTPYPGFMTDWQPPWAVLMTQAEGESIIVERIFENRLGYVNELKKLGAKIEYFRPKINDPENYYFFNYQKDKIYYQAVKIFGPQKLHNGVVKIADLRAGATLAIAALIAKGESIVQGASILERGYENFVSKVRSLGGDIKRQ